MNVVSLCPGSGISSALDGRNAGVSGKWVKALKWTSRNSDNYTHSYVERGTEIPRGGCLSS